MNQDKLSVIITGSTGMVGEAMLLVALKSEKVEKVLIVNRKKSGISHPKLKEVVIPDFHNLTEIENDLLGYNACFFCMGVSSVGMKEDVYYDITYNLTMNFAKTILKMNDEMSFIYVSGAGTSSDENAKSWWARIKGKTENDLMKMNFLFLPLFFLC